MKKVLITLGSVLILAFTGCGGANGVESGVSEVAADSAVVSTESSVVATSGVSSSTTDALSTAQVEESGVSNSSLIADQIASQAEFLGQPVSGIN